MKENLPYPYNQDLSAVLRRLNRVTKDAKERLANDGVTASFLLAGMRLLATHLGPQPQRTFLDPDDEKSLERPLLKLLSQRLIIAEMAKNPDPFAKVGAVSNLRSTWRSQSDYIADLLSFGLWSRHYVGVHADKIAELAEQLVMGTDFIEAVHELCYWDLCTLVDMPSWRLQMVASVMAEDDPVIGASLTQNYRDILKTWQPVHGQAIERLGVRLRPGISLDDLSCLFTALAEGLAFRMVADADARVVDHERRRSLYGVGCLAIFASCTERADDPHTATMEEFTQAVIERGAVFNDHVG
jgi:hypothetical protein